MAAMTTNVVPLAGLVVSTLLAGASAPTNGDDYETGSGVYMLVQNTGGTTATVTLVTPGTVDGDLAISDRTSVTVPATTGLAVIPLVATYRDPATGRGTANFSGGTLKAIVVRTVV